MSSPDGAAPPMTLTVVDIAAKARDMYSDDMLRSLRGGEMPEHDYRFVVTIPVGGRVTFHANATAEHVFTYLQQKFGQVGLPNEEEDR